MSRLEDRYFSRIVKIHSADRDLKSPIGNSNDFVIDLPSASEYFRQVQAVMPVSAYIPNLFYNVNITPAGKDPRFYFDEDNKYFQGAAVRSYVTIKAGRYTLDTLIETIRTELPANLTPFTYQVTPATNRLRFDIANSSTAVGFNWSPVQNALNELPEPEYTINYLLGFRNGPRATYPYVVRKGVTDGSPNVIPEVQPDGSVILNPGGGSATQSSVRNGFFDTTTQVTSSETPHLSYPHVVYVYSEDLSLGATDNGPNAGDFYGLLAVPVTVDYGDLIIWEAKETYGHVQEFQNGPRSLGQVRLSLRDYHGNVLQSGDIDWSLTFKVFYSL